MTDTKLEELRPVVESISESVEKIRQTGSSEKALLVLIQNASPPVLGRWDKPRKPNQKEIKAVLGGMEALEDFVFGDDHD